MGLIIGEPNTAPGNSPMPTLPSTKGSVVWITGLAGSGKTSIAKELVRLFDQRGRKALLLDGEAVRGAVNDPQIGYDRDSRLTQAMRTSRLARLMADQGFTVVVATMSLFNEVFGWNRANLPSYFEVYLQVSLDVLKERDAHGLYSGAASGTTENVVGIHLDFDKPTSPDLVLVNDEYAADVTSFSQQILSCVAETNVMRG